MNTLPFSNRTAISAIITVSTLVFLFLLWLLYFKESSGTETEMDLSFMPALNALLNSACALFLALGVIAIKQGDKERHWRMMLTALDFLQFSWFPTWSITIFKETPLRRFWLYQTNLFLHLNQPYCSFSSHAAHDFHNSLFCCHKKLHFSPPTGKIHFPGLDVCFGYWGFGVPDSLSLAHRLNN